MNCIGHIHCSLCVSVFILFCVEGGGVGKESHLPENTHFNPPFLPLNNMEPLFVIIKPRPGSRRSVCTIQLFMSNSVEDLLIALDLKEPLFKGAIRIFQCELLGALMIYSHGEDSLVLNG